MRRIRSEVASSPLVLRLREHVFLLPGQSHLSLPIRLARGRGLSKGDVYEPALTAAYARGAQGLVIEKFRVASRELDALVVSGDPTGLAHWRDRRTGWYDHVRGRDVTIVQTKA